MERDWGELPTVVVTEIYKYLPSHDRLVASTVCSNWRGPVFQTPLEKSLIFTLDDGLKAAFLAKNFSHKVEKVVVTFDAASLVAIDALGELVRNLEGNCKLKSLRIIISDAAVINDSFVGNTTAALILRKYFIKNVLKPLEKVLEGRNGLEDFFFPLVNDLASYEENFFNSLSNRKSFTTKTLHLGYLQTRNYIPHPRIFDLGRIDRFVNLQILSINHILITDKLLGILGNGSGCKGLQRLCLLATLPNAFVSNDGWTHFKLNNPRCNVELSVGGNEVKLESSSNLLFPSMRLTHFRLFYTRRIRLSLLNSLVSWNESTLIHLELVDEDSHWMDVVNDQHYNQDDGENAFLDPIIYAAWRCHNLRTIKIRFMYCGRNLIGIARLRGIGLKELEIPHSQILFHNRELLSHEISQALERHWEPIDDTGDEEVTNFEDWESVNVYRSLITSNEA